MSSQISISEASRCWKISRQTLYRRINNGDISVSGTGKARRINVSELIRVFGETTPDSPSDSDSNSVEQNKNTAHKHQIDLLKLENQHQKDLINRQDEQINDLRGQVKRLTPVPLLEQLKTIWGGKY